MPADIEAVVNADQLRSALPPGVSLWWVRGKVLHTEIIERPCWIEQRNVYEQSQMAPFTLPDTIITLRDRDTPQAVGYEIRLQGRIDTIAPGEDLELVGHRMEGDTSYLPRMAVSVKHNHWWMALRPVRQGDPDFIAKESNNFRTMKREISYHKELDGVFSVNVPKAAPVMPQAAPSSPFGKLLGAAKQIAASAGPAFTTVDLRPVYMGVYPALVAYGVAENQAEEPAQAESYDSGDDLPPL